jgi:hypothetical protein
MAPEDRAAELQKALAEERARSTRLEADKKAIAEEFADAAGDYDKTIQAARNGIAGMLELAVTTAEQILVNGDTDSVRASMSKFVIEAVLSGKLEREVEGEIKSLIKRLADNDENFKQEAQQIVDSEVTE